MSDNVLRLLNLRKILLEKINEIDMVLKTVQERITVVSERKVSTVQKPTSSHTEQKITVPKTSNNNDVASRGSVWDCIKQSKTAIDATDIAIKLYGENLTRMDANQVIVDIQESISTLVNDGLVKVVGERPNYKYQSKLS